MVASSILSKRSRIGAGTGYGGTNENRVYVNTSKRFGDPDHLKVFANVDAAETWFEKNDPEGVVFEYEVLE
jgi:hypothetical protein